jgi:hypothetical protein
VRRGFDAVSLPICCRFGADSLRFPRDFGASIEHSRAAPFVAGIATGHRACAQADASG